MAEPGTPIRAHAVVRRIGDEGGANRRLELEVDDWPGFAPGQFVMLSPGVRGATPRADPLLPRPMAVYREVPGNGARRIEILFKVHGRGTALLADALPGQRIDLVGPLGRPFPESVSRETSVLVAGGTGIASVYELAAQRAREGTPVHVLLGARSAADLMGDEDFLALGVTLDVATEDGSRGTSGLVTELLESILAREPDAVVYACGPTRMMERAAALAAASGHACWVSLENPMACGFGVCLGCAAPLAEGGFALVCRDGPVFPAESVDWAGLP